jgi:hypothetical protein
LSDLKFDRKGGEEMTKIISYCLVAAVVLFNVGSLNAATSVNLSTTASVSASTPELTVLVKQIDDGDPDNNPWTGSSTVTSMSFGPLIHILDNGQDAGIWFAKRFFCAVVFTQPFGKPYNINSSSSGVTSGVNKLPDASFVLAPGYASQDEWSPGDPQGAIPSGASLGAKGSAVATNKLVYSSETGTATGRIIRAYYSIPPKNSDGSDPYPEWIGAPLGQASGSYSGTVTLTITLK